MTMTRRNATMQKTRLSKTRTKRRTMMQLPKMAREPFRPKEKALSRVVETSSELVGWTLERRVIEKVRLPYPLLRTIERS
jgi:hypothetical protein